MKKKHIDIIALLFWYNFASKLTIFIFDLKNEKIGEIGNVIANYLFDIYEKDK